MRTIQVRIEPKIIKKLHYEYDKQIYNDTGVLLTDSQVVIIALLNLHSLKYNQEIDIIFMKNGKIKYEI